MKGVSPEGLGISPGTPADVSFPHGTFHALTVNYCISPPNSVDMNLLRHSDPSSSSISSRSSEEPCSYTISSQFSSLCAKRMEPARRAFTAREWISLMFSLIVCNPPQGSYPFSFFHSVNRPEKSPRYLYSPSGSLVLHS